MTDISSTKFYHFLSNQGDWATVADSYGNNDGKVSKSEFRKFIADKWEDSSQVDDVINQYWKTMDTINSSRSDLNLLNDKELDAVNKKVEIYVKLDDFVKNNVKVPTTALKTSAVQAQWKADITDELSAVADEYLNNPSGDLDTLLAEKYAEIKTQKTAEYCAIEYQNELLKGSLKNYSDYSIADDSTLQGLISDYVQELANSDAEVTESDIRTGVREIIDNYLATAGFGKSTSAQHSNGVDGTSGGESLNDLQLARLKTDVKNACSTLLTDFSNYSNEINTAIENFINDLVTEYGSYDKIVSSVSDYATAFKASDAYQSLVDLKSIDDNYSTINDSIYAKLKSALGTTIADNLKNNARYVAAYTDLLADIKTLYADGKLTMSGIEDYIVSQIKNNLSQYLSGSLGDISVSDLNTTYDTLRTAANNVTDTTESLNQHRNAAILYCDTLSAKSDKYASVIQEVFGTTDYATKINSMLPAEISTKMETLKTKALAVIDTSGISGSSEIESLWNGISTTYTVGANATKANAFTIPNSLTYNGQLITSDRFSYSSDSSFISIDKTSGKATINGGATAGTYTVNVSVSIDGTQVTTKQMTVTVEPPASSLDWANNTTKYSGYMTTVSGGDINLSTNSLSDMYANNAVIDLNGSAGIYGSELDSAIAGAKTGLSTFVSTLVSALENSGADSAALKTASEKVIELYSTALDKSNSSGDWFKGKGTQERSLIYDGENYGFYLRKYSSQGSVVDYRDTVNASASNNQLGLTTSKQKNNDRCKITVNAKCVMDLLDKFYKQALGS
jgi:hypothetical protein